MTETAALADLQTVLRGDVIDRAHPRYEEARRVYNGMIDKRPALVAQCVDAADVVAAIGYARQNGLDVALRGGGHSGAGFGTADDGLVIDLSQMRGVRVNPRERIAQVAGGSLLGDVDHATHAFSLAVPGGIISTTGVGGLTLGGGTGHLSRKYGLTIDNLLAADVVLADGSFVTASEEENDDLFWSLRGGSGNFGVVTSFTFRLNPVDIVVAGPILWHMDEAADLMRFYHEWIGEQPDDVNGFFAFLIVPPGPPFPEELHMKHMCGIVFCLTCSPAEADEYLQPVRAFGNVALDGVQPMPLPVLNSAFDELFPPGLQQYWRGDFVADLPDEAIERHVEWGARVPTIMSGMHMYPVDGAAGRVRNDETAWAYRDARYAMVMLGADPDPARGDEMKSFAVGYWEAVHPHTMGGSYVNFMMDEGYDRVRATYQDNYDRLAKIKAKYDPDNFFHVNQNIRPAGR